MGERSGKHVLHMCQSVEGALRNWDSRTWRETARANNCTTEYLKKRFKEYLLDGVRVLPLGEPCEGFSYQDGCPGHDVEGDDDN